MERRQFRKNSHNLQNKVLCSHEVVFQAIRKRIISQNCNENSFFFVTFTGHLAYVKVTWSFFNVLKPPRNTSYVAGLKFKIFTKETRIYKNNSCNKHNMRKPNNNRRHNLSLEEKLIF